MFVRCLSWMLLLASVTPLRGATPATASLHCLSLRIFPASARQLGQMYTLAFTTAQDEQAEANGELVPTWDPTLPDHGSIYRLTTTAFPQPLLGEIYIDTPPFVDANENIIQDFFEVSQAVPPTTTTGVFYDRNDNEGSVKAIWSRPANSKTGTCQIQLSGNGLSGLLVFDHTFELWEYRGTFVYQRAKTTATGDLRLAGPSGSPAPLAGPFTLEITNADELHAVPGTWTNESSQAFAFQSAFPFDRYRSNYAGYVDFTNANPVTIHADFLNWILVLMDPNDGNGNGIPDLSDPAVVVRPPVLSLFPLNQDLEFRVSADPGVLCVLEQTTQIPASSWSFSRAFILTNDPHHVLLPKPTNAALFWRARLP